MIDLNKLLKEAREEKQWDRVCALLLLKRKIRNDMRAIYR